MAKASKAPDPTYVRRFTITRHALERFRERVDEEFGSRNDIDLGNVLDERVHHSKDVSPIDDPSSSKPTSLHGIRNRSGSSKYYAIVRDGHVVTVLDQAMIENNFQTGTWKRPINKPFAVLKDVKVEPPRFRSTDTVMGKPLNHAPKPDIGALGSNLARKRLAHAQSLRAVDDMRANITALQNAIVPLVEAAERAEHEATEATQALDTAIKETMKP